uniref:Uncharacterized protein n=2 Tax=Avena sativa TaxID=4498 RepID=A0ACD5UXA1_AVESA
MARKRKRRGDAAATEAGVEVAEREAPGAAAKSATTGNTERRRGGDVTAEQEESTAVHAPGPADSGKETTDREGRKPKLNKKKRNKADQSPCVPASEVAAAATGKFGDDCTDGVGVLGDPEVNINPRNGDDTDHPEVNIREKGTLERKKPNHRKRKKKNMQQRSPSVVSDDKAVEVDKSRTDCKDVPGDDRTIWSPKNEENPCFSSGKNGNNDHSQKPKNKKRKRTKKAQGAVTEIPPVADVSSDERKDVCSTGYMKVPDKSDIIFTTSTSGESHKENVRDIYSPEGSLVRFQRKKLLILDLNGILADINTDRDIARVADGRVRGKNVFKRPYIDDFLRFCFQNFELGIWSSRMKVNVDAVVDILMRDLRRHLVFCWDMSKCTTTQAATLENNRKPLVLKELKKLWNKEDPDLPWEQGEFSPSNTLLVDDSPYKALRNPPYTAIFPQPYSYHIEEDESLGPGGDLRVYLENIAAADDVQHYVQEQPFGQPSITESDPNWNFYAKIHYRLDRRKWS